MRNKLYPAGLCSKTLGKAARRLGACLLCLLLLATALSLPALADEPEQDAWEHTGHGSGWTELTADTLSSLNYTLEKGKYYLSSAERGMLPNQFLMYNMTNPITVTGNVTLCLNNVSYTYTGNEKAAIVVSENASLTICGCEKNGNNYLGTIFSNSVPYTVSNSGTLYIASGGISSSVEYGAAIYNAGTCTISGGKVSGTAGGGWQQPYKTAYGVYNAEGGSLTITGNPEISGQAPGERDEPTGPQIDVYTSDTIKVQNLSNEFEGVKIGFYGEDRAAVVSGVTDQDTAELFTVTDPANSELSYNEENGSLTFEKGEVIDYGSLCFAGEPVVNQTKYKINYTGDTTFSATLEKVDADSEDYDLLWDEDTMTLTLNSATVKANCEYVTGSQEGKSDALISLNCAEKKTLNIQVIGDNSLTVINPFSSGTNYEARAIENKNGDIVFTGSGSLAISLPVSKGYNDQGLSVEQITGIYAIGAVNNQVNLTVTGSDEDEICSSMTGVDCSNFTNSGTFKAEISDANSACAVDADDFSNSGTMDIDLTGVKNGTGIMLTGGTSFTNSGKIDITIPGAKSAQGIGRYSIDGTSVDSGFSWTNAVNGEIIISVSGKSAATAALGGGALAGIDLRSDEDITFDNQGTITATVTSDAPASLSETNWPSWQYFDTLGVLLACGECDLTNSGTMTLKALNGYTAGISVAGSDDNSISITNSGNLDITTTTKGGDNIRSVGIYAEIPNISGTEAKNLPFDTTNGIVSISTTEADGSTVSDENLMAICLVQTFNSTTAPSNLEDFQQITGDGMAISGEPVVYTCGTSVINTIGTKTEDGTITPVTDMVVVPAITGTVTIQGSLQVGSTLASQVAGLPAGVQVAYQWQEADSAEGPFTDIKGAVGQTYIPTSDNVGKYLRVVVTPMGDVYGGELTAVTSGTISRPSIPGGTTYPPVIEDSENGTVTTSPSRPEEGDTVTITPKPDEGFEVGEVLVEDEDGNAIKVTQNPNGTYTFTQPDGKVTITVTFRCDGGELCPSYHLTDITKGEWYHAAVDYVVKQGIMAGTSATTFDPNGKLTRAMAVQILYNLEGQPIVTGTTSFADSTAHWAATPIAWAEQTGVVDGYEDNTFRPENNVTRQEFAQMLYNYAAYKGYDLTAKGDLSQFTDGDSVREWAVTAMSWANGNALINGHDDGTLEPGGTTIRAQATSILMRFDQNVVEN